MKLLIVDDQSTVVQGLLHCTNWAAMGFTVVDTALNAVDAKASLLRQEAEVMLCDIEMPMESGLDLLDWLRQRGMTTRCIFLTAHAEFRYAQEALRLGGFDYIMQPAPYEQVADAVSRALENVKEERAALELQSRGAVFDDQKKEIVETMLRGFLSGNAPGSSLTTFEELSLVPRRERECWVALMQPLRWKQGEEPWELSLLSTAVGNMSSEVFTPLQVLSVTVAIPAEQCLVLVLQSRVGEPLEADYITRQLNYLQSACAQYIHCEAAFYPEGPQPFEQAPEIYQELLQQRSENVALKSGVLLGRPAEKAPEVFRIPQIGAWQKLLQAGCAQAMEQEACQLLDKLTVEEMPASSRRYPFVGFKMDREPGKEILAVEGLTKTVDGRKVLDNVSFRVNKGDKIAFVGEDEIATTTLFKILMEELEPDAGTFKWGTTITTSYFPLDNSAFFNDCDLNLVDWLGQYTADNAEEGTESFKRSFLGRMLFSGDDVYKPVKVLSGGEKVRCMLSRMMLFGSNALVLDQPTNHLDLESITAVNNGLIDFKGVVLFASHDHEFVQTIANRVMEFVDGKLIDKMCTYDAYIAGAREEMLARLNG